MSLPSQVLTYCQSHARIVRYKLREEQLLRDLKEKEKCARESVESALYAEGVGKCIVLDVDGVAWYVLFRCKKKLSLTVDMVQTILEDLRTTDVDDSVDLRDAIVQAFRKKLHSIQEDTELKSGTRKLVVTRHRPKGTEPLVPGPELARVASAYISILETKRAAGKRMREETKLDRETCKEHKEEVIEHIKQTWPTELSASVRVKSPKSGRVAEGTMRCVKKATPSAVPMRVVEMFLREECEKPLTELALKKLSQNAERALQQRQAAESRFKLDVKLITL